MSVATAATASSTTGGGERQGIPGANANTMPTSTARTSDDDPIAACGRGSSALLSTSAVTRGVRAERQADADLPGLRLTSPGLKRRSRKAAEHGEREGQRRKRSSASTRDGFLSGCEASGIDGSIAANAERRRWRVYLRIAVAARTMSRCCWIAARRQARLPTGVRSP